MNKDEAVEGVKNKISTDLQGLSQEDQRDALEQISEDVQTRLDSLPKSEAADEEELGGEGK